MENQNSKRSLLLPIAAATLLLGVTAGVLHTSASEATAPKMKKFEVHFQGKGMEGAFQDIQAAIEKNDFNAWKEAISKTPLAQKDPEAVSQQTFDAMVKVDQLMKAGDKEGAKAALEGIKGLQVKFFPMAGKGKWHEGFGTEEQRAAVEKALDAKDYQAWKAAVGAIDSDSKLLQAITADNFSTYLELRGVEKKVMELRQRLGLVHDDFMIKKVIAPKG